MPPRPPAPPKMNVETQVAVVAVVFAAPPNPEKVDDVIVTTLLLQQVPQWLHARLDKS